MQPVLPGQTSRSQALGGEAPLELVPCALSLGFAVPL